MGRVAGGGLGILDEGVLTIESSVDKCNMRALLNIDKIQTYNRSMRP